MSTAAIIFIGTNKYAQFFAGFHDAVNKNFCNDLEKTFFVFTDQPNDPVFQKDNVEISKVEHLDWPFITLYRFKFMDAIRDKLEKFDYTFFIDADLWPVKEIKLNELFGENDFVAVQHPGFVGRIGTFETSLISTATVLDKKYDLSVYRQGCFWGGKSNEINAMTKELNDNVDKDLSNDFVSCWHDESHMNKFFLKNLNRVLTIHPGYATPQEGYEHIKSSYEMKMIHLHKDINEFPRFAGLRG